MAETLELPHPDSEQLLTLVGSSAQRLLYGFLHRRRDRPPTMGELRLFVADALGEDQSEIDRRIHELRRVFDLPVVRVDGEARHRLSGWAPHRPEGIDGRVSARRRAEVLAPGRCGMCGKTPIEDKVRLDVDFKIPMVWGGTSDVENLQPLCEVCSEGKRDYFQTFEGHAEKIRAAITHDEPQKRIGELLKAFDGGWVRSDLLSLVASAKEYQDDWQRRLRDLRFIGWNYTHEKRHNEGARVWTYYRLTKSAPWPANIHAAIKAEEAKRKAAKSN